MNVYPPMSTGRFVVIADFEDPVHLELVMFSTNSPSAGFARSEVGGRPETGPGCLKLRVTGPNDVAVFSNRASSSWYLKRDWRGYDAMLLAAYVPTGGIDLTLTLRSGRDAQSARAETTQRLQPGWNALSVSLAEAAERIAMDDVREVRIAFAGMREPTDIVLDDLILTADRTTIFGDPENLDGRMYAQHVADRILVGAGGRFELAFDNAQIAQWYDRAADPHRLRDMTAGATLGPVPVALTDAPDGAGSAPQRRLLFPGRAVLARQRLLEVNEVRAVVECLWHFVNDADDPIVGRPTVRRVFTIYPTGQLFVEVTADAGDHAPPGLEVGLRVSLDSGDRRTDAVGIGATPPQSDGAYGAYAWAGSEESGGHLLFVAMAPGTPLTMREDRKDQDDLTRLVATGVAPDATRWSWNVLVWLRLPDPHPGALAADVAAAYVSPPALPVEVGAVDEGVSPTGFDRASGLYRINPEHGRLRLKLEAGRAYTHSPGILVTETSDRDCWVYLDDAVFDRASRNHNGNLVFQVHTPRSRTTAVEVLTRRRSTTSPS